MATLICNGVLFDGTPRDPITRGAVLVEGNRIVAVGPEGQVQAPADTRVLDAGGGTILPGLFNLHDHVTRKQVRVPPRGVSMREITARFWTEPLYYQVLHSARNVLDEMRSGVTTIVDFGGGGHSTLALKRSINEGVLPGPRILAAGNALCMTGGHGYGWSQEADGPEEVRKGARQQIKAGADHIKMMASGGLGHFPDELPAIVQYTYEELLAGVSEAHKFHKRTAAHAYATEGVKNAVRAGIDSIEHGGYLDEESVEMMKKRNVAVVPTVSGLVHLPVQYRVVGRQDLHDRMMEEVIIPQQTSIRMAVEAGLKVGTGSDSAGEVVEEMELLQEIAGMSNLDCLRAATSVAAEIAWISNLTGTLEPGKRADLVVVDGQPLERLSDLRKPKWVLRDGQLFEGAPMPLGVRMRVLTGQ